MQSTKRFSATNILKWKIWLPWLAAFGLIFAPGEMSGQAQKPPAPAPRGFSYHHDEVQEKPWSIHIIKIDRSNTNLELHTTLGGGDRIGLATLSRQIRTLPPELGRAVAGVNGDYFYNDYPYPGDPKGLQIRRGELVSAPNDWTCFWLDQARQPHMTNVVAHFEVTWPGGQQTAFGLNEERPSGGLVLFTAAIGATTLTRGGLEIVLERDGTNSWLPLQAGKTYSARIRELRETGNTRLSKDTLVLSVSRGAMSDLPKVAVGDMLKISTKTTPDLEGVMTAIGGGPPLVRAGQPIGHDQIRVRHPRAALGWNRSEFFLVEVDGRQRYLSVGMTLSELSEYMAKLGCEEAMCLDGGGSATCWVTGQVMNSPSEGRERPMANALVLVLKK